MKKIVKDDDLQIVYRTAKDLSAVLGVSERQVHYYRTNGKLKSGLRNRTRYEYLREDVIDFLVKEWGFEYEGN